MARSIVLLEREVDFSFHEPATGGGGGESIRSSWEGIQGLASPQELSDAVTKYMGTFKARAVIADPPQICSLRILVPTEYLAVPPPLQGIRSARISSADKHLVALCAGDCRPGTGRVEIGGYLIYDACKDSLSVVPKLLDRYFHASIGCQSAVVMCNDGDDGGYFLAELVWLRSEYSQAVMWLWKSSAPGWSLKPARMRLPPGFCSNLCFCYRGSILCWVDLLEGMVMCDLGKDCSNLDCPELRFIQLPKDCPSYDSSDLWNRYHLCPEKFRSMACVGDTIKFVCMDSNVEEHTPGKGFDLSVYSLLPDLSDWEISSRYNVEKIWANESYHSTGMAKIDPSFPVLSIHEHGVIYLVFTDLRVVDDTPHHTGQRRVELNSQYLVRVDIENNKVHCYPWTTDCSIGDDLLGSDFSVYRQCLQDHPREIEATEMVATGKRTKLSDVGNITCGTAT